MLTKKFNSQCITYSQMNMISNSRLFWRRFTTWIRVFILSRYLGIGTGEDSFRRLYSETSGIGSFLQIVFDREISNNISQLLNQFTFALRDLIDAQMRGNSQAVNQNVTRIYQVASNFASYLASVNPSVNETELLNMLHTYIEYTIEEANSFISGDYSHDIEAYKKLTDLANRMGDFLAQSLVDYINAGYSLTPQGNLQCITFDQINLIYTIRMFWYELFTWIRYYMLSRFRGVGNAEVVKARLNEVPAEYINALQQFFGVNLESYLQVLNTKIDLIDNLITAQQTGNISEINRITQLLYQNADQAASSIAALNPNFWDVSEWRTVLYNSLRYTIEESTTFLTGDYNENLDIFRSLLDMAESNSSFFARGLFSYLMSQSKVQ